MFARFPKICYTETALRAKPDRRGNMKPSIKRLLNFAFLFLTLGIVLYIGLNGNDLNELGHALSTISPVFLLLCLLGWVLYILTDALAVYFYLKQQGHSVKLWQSIHAAITGIYYCNVTPGASGGQPLEIYTLRKYGAPIGISGSAMVVKFICFQMILLIAGVILWVTHGAFVSDHTQGSIWFVILGYLVNCFSIGIVLMMSISQRAVRWLIAFCIKIGVKLHLCKNPEASTARWEDHCQTFFYSFRQLVRSPVSLLTQCGVALLQLFSLMLPIIAVYHAFGLSEVSSMELITMGVLLYIGASYTPLPGASGAQEGGFAVLFKGIFPDARLFVALLIWRFSTYYLNVIVGAVVATVSSIRGIKNASDTQEGVSNEQS